MAFTFYTVVNEDNGQNLFKLAINILDNESFGDLKIIYLMAVNNQILGSGIYKIPENDADAMIQLLTDFSAHANLNFDLSKIKLVDRRDYDYRKLLEFGIIAMENRLIAPGYGITIAP